MTKARERFKTRMERKVKGADMDGDQHGKLAGHRTSLTAHRLSPRSRTAPPLSVGASPVPPSRDDVGAEEEVDLADIVGRNLRRLRTQRGHSLSRLAEASGVSRAMLGQIELGRSVPSIGVLWKIARALDVRFAAFTVDAQAGGTVVMRAAQAKVLMSQDGAFASRALFPADAHRRVEFYHLRLAAGGVEDAPAHPVGTIENLVVERGMIEVDVGDKRHWLATGDAILFEADIAHCYRNAGNEDAIMYLVIIYSDVPASK